MTLALVASCDNPFFPPTGLPDASARTRSTPSGVLKQLVKSYETRRIGLFRDLMAPDGSFRYYVPQTSLAALDLQNLGARATYELIGRQLAFIDSGANYEYTSYSDELTIHRNLFEQAQEVVFDVEPRADSVVYYDTLIRVDSTVIVDYDSLGGRWDTLTVPRTVYDTFEVEMRTAPGAKILVTADILQAVYGTATYQFDIGAQVFVLRRDPLDVSLWIIDKWFELP